MATELSGRPLRDTRRDRALFVDREQTIEVTEKTLLNGGNVLLVGHEPAFSDEIARLTGGRVKLRKGGLAIVDGSTLTALLRPADLGRIAASS